MEFVNWENKNRIKNENVSNTSQTDKQKLRNRLKIVWSRKTKGKTCPKWQWN